MLLALNAPKAAARHGGVREAQCLAEHQLCVRDDLVRLYEAGAVNGEQDGVL